MREIKFLEVLLTHTYQSLLKLDASCSLRGKKDLNVRRGMLTHLTKLPQTVDD